jgi:hypothetical protein
MERNYVVVKFTDGRVKVWRDYGETWGSPIYEVIGYFDTYKAALAGARLERTSTSTD